MKGPLDRTKVVLRHLPPTISQSNLVEYLDSRFSGRYRWLAFRAGKPSLKHVAYSRAYIDFNKPDDVIEFAEFFDGHVFVNEKGTQFKAIVEYAPSQRIPKQCSKKDGREGTILKDPEYLEFLELISKPVENLPSAEIQLERKEAERAGAAKDFPIVTPLMEYIRQKRAAKGGARKTMLNGKPTRRVGGISSRIQAPGSSKRGSGKRTPTTMYVPRESTKGAGRKDKSTKMLVRKPDDRQILDNSVDISAISKNDSLEGGIGSGSAEFGKKKILLVKGKGKELSNVSGGSSPQLNAASPAKNSPAPASLKQNQRREAGGRIIKSILLNRDPRLNQPSPGSQSEQRIHPINQDDKKPPRPPSVQSFQKDANGVVEDRVGNNDLHTINTEKHERRTRNKDRPDRDVWTPFRHSDGLHASDESLSSSTSQSSQVVDCAEGTRVDMKPDMPVAHGGEYRPVGSGRGSHYSDNGSYRHGVRRGSVSNVKDVDGSSVVEARPSKRSVPGYGTHEKQVWVQKSSSGS